MHLTSVQYAAPYQNPVPLLLPHLNVLELLECAVEQHKHRANDYASADMNGENVHAAKYREAKAHDSKSVLPIADLFRLDKRTIVSM